MSIRLMAQVWELEVPHAEQWVLLALADHADDSGEGHPGIPYLAWKVGYSERSVQRALHELGRRGFLRATRGPSGRGHYDYYQITLSEAPSKPAFSPRIPAKPDEAVGLPPVAIDEAVGDFDLKGDKAVGLPPLKGDKAVGVAGNRNAETPPHEGNGGSAVADEAVAERVPPIGSPSDSPSLSPSQSPRAEGEQRAPAREGDDREAPNSAEEAIAVLRSLRGWPTGKATDVAPSDIDLMLWWRKTHRELAVVPEHLREVAADGFATSIAYSLADWWGDGKRGRKLTGRDPRRTFQNWYRRELAKGGPGGRTSRDGAAGGDPQAPGAGARRESVAEQWAAAGGGRE